MKNVYFPIIFLFITCVISRAQSVFPTYEDNPSWRVFQQGWHGSGGEIAYTIWLRKDTNVCGQNYNPVIAIDYPRVADTTILGYYRKQEKRVLFRAFGENCANGEEYAIYDFGLKKGDTLDIGGGRIAAVDTVWNYLQNGRSRKALSVHYQYMYGPSLPHYTNWVEGIGEREHPFLTAFCYSGGCWDVSNILCSRSNGIVTYSLGTGSCDYEDLEPVPPVFPTYEQSPVWCIKETVFGRPQPLYTIELGSDTLICGKKYNPFLIKNYPNADGTTSNRIGGYIRQNNKKVYQSFGECQLETLLYDFSLQVGDTIRHSIFDEMGIVTKIDTQDINGVKRKRMIINYSKEYSPTPVPSLTRFWIEGIGSSFNPDGGLDCLTSACEYTSSVICLSTNTGVISSNCTEGCGIRTAINELSSSLLRFNLVANPIAINTSVQLRYDNENDFRGKFYVSNLFGQVLFTKALILYQTKKRIDLPWSPTIPGIYLLVFESDRGERQALRLVAQ